MNTIDDKGIDHLINAGSLALDLDQKEIATRIKNGLSCVQVAIEDASSSLETGVPTTTCEWYDTKSNLNRLKSRAHDTSIFNVAAGVRSISKDLVISGKVKYCPECGGRITYKGKTYG